MGLEGGGACVLALVFGAVAAQSGQTLGAAPVAGCIPTSSDPAK